MPREADVHGRAASNADVSLSLLGGFRLDTGAGTPSLPRSAQRLVAFLALQRGPVHRQRIFGTLWPEVADDRAAGNLRSVLWRMGRLAVPIIEGGEGRLQLAAGVVVDLHQLLDWAHRVIQDQPTVVADGMRFAVAGPGAVELLPDWYEDWVVEDRERVRQLWLHALDGLCQELVRAGRLAEAVAVGSAAVAAEPLRESAHRALIAAHLAEGNASEALRQSGKYQAMLRRELGLDPSPAMRALVAALENGDAPGALAHPAA